MIKLLENNLELKVRKDEVSLIKGMLKDCEKLFKDTMLAETKRTYECNLEICEDIFLEDREGGACGGIILLAHGRRIVVPNTLEDRMNLCFEQELPLIRHGLFPVEK
jgi:vacuolar-type H+-ATPase subunit E/Vma4